MVLYLERRRHADCNQVSPLVRPVGVSMRMNTGHRASWSKQRERSVRPTHCRPPTTSVPELGHTLAPTPTPTPLSLCPL
ncbi:hypothetical protein FS749_008197 [Ceratobasidium sp. UAMH 11750]|nr:hypothetical protein FS749_008197 [Ceratobasidium sp. UAMH 11750]